MKSRAHTKTKHHGYTLSKTVPVHHDVCAHFVAQYVSINRADMCVSSRSDFEKKHTLLEVSLIGYAFLDMCFEHCKNSET